MSDEESVQEIGRYAVFAYSGFYPYGGWNDYQAAFESIKLARKFIETNCRNKKYSHIVDLRTGKICVKMDNPNLSFYD